MILIFTDDANNHFRFGNIVGQRRKAEFNAVFFIAGFENDFERAGFRLKCAPERAVGFNLFNIYVVGLESVNVVVGFKAHHVFGDK